MKASRHRLPLPCRSAVLVLAVSAAAIPGRAELVHGPEAREHFEALHAGAEVSLLDFDSLPPGPMSPVDVGGLTVTARTTERRYPSRVAVDWPVSVLPYSFVGSTPSGTRELMGVASAGGSPDGQSRYEIRFSEPQLRAGLQRNWNTFSVTRFYNDAGSLLAEHRNTVNHEFVGWIGDAGEPATRVARIEMDGEIENGVTQHVGFADDLYFGSGGGEPEPGTVLYGPEARAVFETGIACLGDTLADFESFPGGPLTSFEAGGITVEVATTEQRYPSGAMVDWPVVVLPHDFVRTTPSGTHELMGVRSAGGLPDGQSRYEIRFSEPQRRAGVQRNWNTFSITRFYSAAGALLGEHRNTVNREYVGYVSGGDDPAGWVARIEMDGAVEGGVTWQVGNTDDLIFGSGEPVAGVAPRITRILPNPGGGWILNWEPLLDGAYVEFSSDLREWNEQAGPVSGTEWSGSVPDEVGYFRIRHPACPAP